MAWIEIVRFLIIFGFCLTVLRGIDFAKIYKKEFTNMSWALCFLLALLLAHLINQALKEIINLF